MLEHYRTWLKKKPGDRLAMYGLALELKKHGRMDEAIEAFEALLVEHPTSGAGWFQYGELFEQQGDELKALGTWKRGLEALEGCTDPEARRSVSEIELAIDSLT